MILAQRLALLEEELRSETQGERTAG
jgi:hypothetical protein